MKKMKTSSVHLSENKATYFFIVEYQRLLVSIKGH